jgi:sulfatase modifying factor 1
MTFPSEEREMFKRMNAVLAALVVGALAASSPVWADDTDGDGADDVNDVCEGTPSGTAVDAEGRPLGDIDLDCDTDLDDFALFQQGLTGPLAYVVIDTVPVGNPGNPDDTYGDGYGGVAYMYRIGKYEVTAGQYCAFLNAVASTDTYGLYNTSMWSSDYGCKIERSGSSGSYTYSVAGDWADRPVDYVSWGDAARFANWLHNGQPMGDQDLTTTEDGSYYLNGAMTDVELLAITREPDATWVIPSEDEWYKAAYHHNDGVTGNYFDYATSSDSAPGYVNDSGNLSGMGTPFTEGGTDPGNYATYDGDGGVAGIGSPYYRTEVGEWENSASLYGTFDQGGNVWEWNEAIISGSYRGVRGGAFLSSDVKLHASWRADDTPTLENGRLGFRIAMVN